MSEKHNLTIFETFEATFVILSITSVKLCFTKSPLKINRLPPMSNINDCTKFQENQLKMVDVKKKERKNELVDTIFFPKVVP